jgi:hypothetical protein
MFILRLCNKILDFVLKLKINKFLILMKTRGKDCEFFKKCLKLEIRRKHSIKIRKEI